MQAAATPDRLHLDDHGEFGELDHETFSELSDFVPIEPSLLAQAYDDDDFWLPPKHASGKVSTPTRISLRSRKLPTDERKHFWNQVVASSEPSCVDDHAIQGGANRSSSSDSRVECSQRSNELCTLGHNSPSDFTSIELPFDPVSQPNQEFPSQVSPSSTATTSSLQCMGGDGYTQAMTASPDDTQAMTANQDDTLAEHEYHVSDGSTLGNGEWGHGSPSGLRFPEPQVLPNDSDTQALIAYPSNDLAPTLDLNVLHPLAWNAMEPQVSLQSGTVVTHGSTQSPTVFNFLQPNRQNFQVSELSHSSVAWTQLPEPPRLPPDLRHHDHAPSAWMSSFLSSTQESCRNSNSADWNTTPFALAGSSLSVSTPPFQRFASMPSPSESQESPMSSESSVTTTETHRPPLPTRPLSAYNYFFRLERERILQDDLADVPSQSDAAPLSLRREWLNHHHWTMKNSVEIQRCVLQEQWAKDASVKRKHVKVHGRISFSDLSRHISVGWKKLPEAAKEVFRAIARQDHVRYNRELIDHQRGCSGNYDS